MREKHQSDGVSGKGLEKERLPGQIEINIPGFGAGESVGSGIQKSESQGLVKKLHEEGKHIIAKVQPGKLVLYVAVSTALIGGIAGGVYLRRRKGKNG